MGAFLHAVSVFADHLAAVHWELLAIALGLHFAKILLRAIAWHAIAPARTGDLVKLYLVRHRIEGSHYPTLAPTLAAETVLDFFVAGGLMIWALSIGVLPTHQVYSRLPTVDWKFLFRYENEAAIIAAALVTATVIGALIFLEHGGQFRARIRQGFAIFGDPPALVRGVLLPQSLS